MPRIRLRPLPLLALSLLVALAFVAGRALTARLLPPPGPPAVPGLLWPNPPRLAPFALDDTDGGTFDEGALRGRWTLLFIGYTRCAEHCPATLTTLAAARPGLERLPAFRTHGQMVFVSVDEDYDTPAVLRAFVARFGGGVRALHGDLQRLHLFTRQLDLQFVKSWSDEGDAYWFDHSGALVLIDPELRALAGFDYPLSPDDLVRRVGDIVDWVARTP